MKQWRCKICDYVHTGLNPPDVCPVCGAETEFFKELEEEVKVAAPATQDNLQKVLLEVPCGLMMVGSKAGERYNGMINNTIFQVTNTPLQVVLGMDKTHLTTDYIKESGVFSVNFLSPDQLGMVRTFGFQSGREVNKFDGVEINWYPGVTGAPVLKGTPGYFECKADPGKTMDAGTHLVFLAEVIDGSVRPEAKVLTYQEYRERKQELWQ
jgi:flavin reductase (DIM6/NTAB) family NADH-FMN oxidoreductase RutF